MDWKGVKGIVMEHVPMKRYTSMRVGGQARFLVYPADDVDLVAAVGHTRLMGAKWRFLGNGTNVIVSDRGLDETCIRMTRVKHIGYEKTKEGAAADVSGGVSLRFFIKDCSRRGLSGLEKLYWIPGTVGGAVKMNAGSFGQHISDRIESVTIVDGDGVMKTMQKEEMNFGYRTSPVKATDCVVSARFHLGARERRDILADMEYVYSERKKRHPMEYPSAGSVFKSVKGEPAWRFIEQAGLKGVSVGGAQVSEKHANFIVNRGGASAQDVKDLIEKVKREVYEKLGVILEEEVELWGFGG